MTSLFRNTFRQIDPAPWPRCRDAPRRNAVTKGKTQDDDSPSTGRNRLNFGTFGETREPGESGGSGSARGAGWDGDDDRIPADATGEENAGGHGKTRRATEWEVQFEPEADANGNSRPRRTIAPRRTEEARNAFQTRPILEARSKSRRRSDSPRLPPPRSFLPAPDLENWMLSRQPPQGRKHDLLRPLRP